MNYPKVLLEGGGGHAKVVIDCLLSEGREVVGIFDPKYEGQLFGVPAFRKYDEAFRREAGFIIAIGNNAKRKEVAGKIRHSFTTTSHTSAIISPFTKIGSGCMIFHRAIIQTGSLVGNHVILNTGAQVDHDATIADFVHVAPRATLCGNVTVGEGTLIGAGAVVLPGVTLGKWAIVGAGAVVSADVPDYAVVVGVPARFVKENRP